MKRLGLILLIVFMLLFFTACSQNTDNTVGIVKLQVTKDFAQETIFAKNLKIDSSKSVMNILQDNLQVDTAYGGSFINSINGMKSGYTNTSGDKKQKMDWFYYVNGIMTAVGAGDYIPVKGDNIWWDYHSWGNTTFTPAVIGAFPQPFLNGYENKNPGTLILTTEEQKSSAEKIQKKLKELGVKNIEIKDYSKDALEQSEKITLVVALWSEIKNSPFWQGIMENKNKTGLFVNFNNKVEALNINGKVMRTFTENTGVILATGSGLGDSTPLWLVTGYDLKGLQNAENIIINQPEKLQKKFAVIVVDEKVVSLPIKVE